MIIKRKAGRPIERQPPTRTDLVNDLVRNSKYFLDTESVNWGGADENNEKRDIYNHLEWIIKTLRSEDYDNV